MTGTVNKMIGEVLGKRLLLLPPPLRKKGREWSGSRRRPQCVDGEQQLPSSKKSPVLSHTLSLPF